MSAQPLAGRRVLVTRAAHQAGKLSQGLRALGAEPVEVPVLEICPPASFDPLDAALRQLDSYHWLVLTSANTVRALADRATALKSASHPSFVSGHAFRRAENVTSLEGASQVAEKLTGSSQKCQGTTSVVPYVADNKRRTLAPAGGASPVPATSLSAMLAECQSLQVAAIGEATAEAARKAGLPVSLVPESYVAESLIQSLREKVAGSRILLARAAIARDVIPDALRAAGAQVDVVDAYRNAMPEGAPEQLRQALAAGIDAATFTSSSSVTHLADAAHAAGLAWPFAGVAAVSIGPITSQTLRELVWEPAAEADPSDIAGLIGAVARVLSKES